MISSDRVDHYRTGGTLPGVGPKFSFRTPHFGRLGNAWKHNLQWRLCHAQKHHHQHCDLTGPGWDRDRLNLPLADGMDLDFHSRRASDSPALHPGGWRGEAQCGRRRCFQAVTPARRDGGVGFGRPNPLSRIRRAGCANALTCTWVEPTEAGGSPDGSISCSRPAVN